MSGGLGFSLKEVVISERKYNISPCLTPVDWRTTVGSGDGVGRRILMILFFRVRVYGTSKMLSVRIFSVSYSSLFLLKDGF